MSTLEQTDLICNQPSVQHIQGTEQIGLLALKHWSPFHMGKFLTSDIQSPLASDGSGFKRVPAGSDKYVK